MVKFSIGVILNLIVYTMFKIERFYYILLFPYSTENIKISNRQKTDGMVEICSYIINKSLWTSVIDPNPQTAPQCPAKQEVPDLWYRFLLQL